MDMMIRATLVVSVVGLALICSAALPEEAGDAAKGEEVFERCGVCHYADREEMKIGPSLKGLFKKEKMQNGKKPTEENVTATINKGGGGMPAYKEILTSEELEHLLAYLRAL